MLRTSVAHCKSKENSYDDPDFVSYLNVYGSNPFLIKRISPSEKRTIKFRKRKEEAFKSTGYYVQYYGFKTALNQPNRHYQVAKVFN